MKKIISITLLFLLYVPNILLAEEQKIEYPKYFGTKKCEITTGDNNSKIFAYNNPQEKNYYIYEGDLYKDGELYKSGVDYLIYEQDGKVIYGIRNKDKIEIYINEKKVLGVDSFIPKTFNYDKYINRYYFELYDNGKHYIYSNGEIYDADKFEKFNRFFSQNKKYFIDLYENSSGFRLEKNGKNILEKKGNFNISEVAISNDNKNYSLSTKNYTNSYLNNKNLFIKNGEESKTKNVEKIKYSPIGKDLYFATKKDSNVIFYKNDKKIGEFNGDVNSNFSIDFFDDNNFYTILTNWSDYAFIKNGKTITGYDSDIQVKLILKKQNGDIFVVIRNKKLSKDTFYINGKKIVQADEIDERYLNDGIGTFSLFPNKVNSQQYYTYVKNNHIYDLYVNGFIIPNMYDYLRLEDGLDNFSFLGKDGYGKISCKDITFLYPDLSIKRQDFEKVLLEINDLSKKQKNILQNELYYYLKNKTLSKKTYEIIKMINDNLNNI